MIDATAVPTLPPRRAAENGKFEAALNEARARIGSTYGLLLGGEAAVSP